MDNKKLIITLIIILQKIKFDVKKIHWTTNNKSTHLLCDDVHESMDEFQDAIAENISGIYGSFEMEELSTANAILGQVQFEDLDEIFGYLIGQLIDLRSSFNENSKEIGLINIFDDYVTELNKFTYLSHFQ